jgi:hypothetical protein
MDKMISLQQDEAHPQRVKTAAQFIEKYVPLVSCFVRMSFVFC